MQDEFAVTAHWKGEFDEAGLQSWAEQLRGQLRSTRVSLGLVFMTPGFFSHAAQVLEILRVHAHIPLLAGCSSASLIVDGREIEDAPGLVTALFALTGAELKSIRFTQQQVEEANGPGYWHLETGLGQEQTNGWLIFADPFHLDVEGWLRGWNEAFAPLPVRPVPAAAIIADRARRFISTAMCSRTAAWRFRSPVMSGWMVSFRRDAPPSETPGPSRGSSGTSSIRSATVRPTRSWPKPWTGSPRRNRSRRKATCSWAS